MRNDVVNEFFHRFYPPDAATNWKPRSAPGGGIMREYDGDRAKWQRVFPYMVCADGLQLSVQGHAGAYSHPRDDFAERYDLVEIMGPRMDEEFGCPGSECGAGADEWIYGYVPIARVVAVIAKHGGLVEAEGH